MSSYEENEKKVQIILERGIGILAQNYTVRKLDAGEFTNPVTAGIQFRIAHYEIENVGHLMTMHTENNPHMLMATYTLTPYFKKLPLISSDFIYNEEGGMFLIEINELVKKLQFDKDELENKRNEILNERKRNEQDFEVINNAMNTVRKVNNNQGYVEKTRVEFWANKFNISFDVLKRQIEKENIEIKDIKQRDDTDTNEAQPY